MDSRPDSENFRVCDVCFCSYSSKHDSNWSSLFVVLLYISSGVKTFVDDSGRQLEMQFLHCFCHNASFIYWQKMFIAAHHAKRKPSSQWGITAVWITRPGRNTEYSIRAFDERRPIGWFLLQQPSTTQRWKNSASFLCICLISWPPPPTFRIQLNGNAWSLKLQSKSWWRPAQSVDKIRKWVMSADNLPNPSMPATIISEDLGDCQPGNGSYWRTFRCRPPSRVSGPLDLSSDAGWSNGSAEVTPIINECLSPDFVTAESPARLWPHH